MPDNDKMYAKIVMILLEQGLTLQYIAKECGVHRSLVGRWRDGVTKPKNAQYREKLQWLAAHLIAQSPEAAAMKVAGRKKLPREFKRRPKPTPQFDAARVKKLLADNGWSYELLGRLTGVTRQNVLKWAQGKTVPSAAADKLLLQLEAHPPSIEEARATSNVLDQMGVGRINAIKQHFGWTNEQFAHALGVGVGTLKEWLSGHRIPTGGAWRALKNLEDTAGLMAEED